MSRLILGLDLGESSLGGALIQVDEEEQLEQIVWANSRVFSGVVDQKSKVTLNQKRRGFRGQRRTVDRKARRRRRIENELARIGLLPTSQQERDIVLGRNNPSKNPYLNPYELRAKALQNRKTTRTTLIFLILSRLKRNPSYAGVSSTLLYQKRVCGPSPTRGRS